MRNLFLAAGLVVVIASASPAETPPAATTAPAASAVAPPSAPAAALPPPPAFYTGAVSRVRGIEGDSFLFERDDRKVVRVRLYDADCRPLGAAAAAQARAVATTLLETQPMWVFPCGQTKGAAGDEIWACVWTSKGWLSEVLVRAGYAQRRSDFDALSLGPVEAGPVAAGPPPGAPALAGNSCNVVEGDTFETEHAGRKLRVRLSDVTCQGVEDAQRESAKTTAARLLGAGTFWVLPCLVRKGGPQDDVLARVWTKEGWLSEALVRAGEAKRCADPDKLPAAAVASTEPPKKAEPPKRPPVKPDPRAVKWREISVPAGGATTMACQSGHFKMDVPEWRISWNLKPWRTTGVSVSLSVCRVDDSVTSGGTSTHVASFAGLTGSQIVRARPGTFWIQVTGSGKLDVKVEAPEQ